MCLLAGCEPEDPGADGPSIVGPTDGAAHDAFASDVISEFPDASDLDANELDANELDAALLDADPIEAGSVDAEPTPDAAADAGVFDAAPADSGTVLACWSCHGTQGDPSPPPDLSGSFDRRAPGVGAHEVHLRVQGLFRRGQCRDCHEVPAVVEAPGHLGPTPAEVVFSSTISSADGVTPSYAAGRCSSYCHGASLGGGTHTNPSWTEGQGQVYCGTCHSIPPPPPHPAVRNGCGGCHPFNGGTPRDPERHVNGVVDFDVTSCGACHEVPPRTGTHMLHAGLAERAYGGLGTASALANPTGYAFGCGYCHPLSSARHINGGFADVELFNASAPAGTLKAANIATARYTPGTTVRTDTFGLSYTEGTCSDVVCHSGLETSAPSVPAPGSDFAFTSYPIVYPPFQVVRSPFYRDVVWGSILTCGGCHDYPPRTDEPAAEGGAGSSHASLDAYGTENLHIFNHGSEPVPCRACHVSTVSEKATWARNANDITTLDDIAISGFDRHVNGVADVVINTGEVVELRGQPRALAGVTFDPSTKTCRNVPCHLNQVEVTWGTPYRWSNSFECNSCHRF